MSFEIVERPLLEPKVWRCVHRLLERNQVCAVATVAPGHRAHVNTVYFAYAPDLKLYFYSYPGTQHAANLRVNPSMAVAVFDPGQTWGHPDRGLQLFGRGLAVRGRFAREAEDVYDARFPGHVSWRVPSPLRDASPPVPYRFRPSSLKLFDEREFGAGIFVHCKVPRSWRASQNPLVSPPREAPPAGRAPARRR